MSLLSEVRNASAAELAELKQMLAGVTDTSGRTPEILQPLHDLNQMPAADNPRPLFVWSAESPKRAPVGRPTEYRKLMWKDNNIKTEITVNNADEEAAKKKLGYSTVNPGVKELTPQERAAEEFAALSPEDQAIVLDAQRQARIARVTRSMEALTDAEILTATMVPAVKKRA